jgi:hypothetical protein
MRKTRSEEESEFFLEIVGNPANDRLAIFQKQLRRSFIAIVERLTLPGVTMNIGPASGYCMVRTNERWI